MWPSLYTNGSFHLHINIMFWKLYLDTTVQIIQQALNGTTERWCQILSASGFLLLARPSIHELKFWHYIFRAVAEIPDYIRPIGSLQAYFYQQAHAGGREHVLLFIDINSRHKLATNVFGQCFLHIYNWFEKYFFACKWNMIRRRGQIKHLLKICMIKLSTW
jgi:hypothetical protein